MTAVAETRLLGDPVDRVDGPLKVTGAAPYPSDVRLPDMAHAALVRSTIAAGRIRRGDLHDRGEHQQPARPVRHRHRLDDTVTVYDTTQWTSDVRAGVATAFQLPEAAVRVHAPYVGGGFGAGLRVWQHVLLTVLAARTVRRPVKLILTRPQMFTGIGHRPNTEQTLRIGATRDGRLVAIDHQATHGVAMDDANTEPVTLGSSSGYACPNLSARDRQRRLNIPPPGPMRGPGEAQGNLAVESAIDELSYELGMDPLELRRRNYGEVHPQFGQPWSSKALWECYSAWSSFRSGSTSATPTCPGPRQRVDRVSPPPWGPRSTPPARRSSSGCSTWSRTTATPRCGAAQSTTSPGDASTAGTTPARVSATPTSWLVSAWMSFPQTA